VPCYDAAYDPATGRGHLLLEDLSPTHYLPPRRYPPPETVCTQAIDLLAQLHARWWRDPRLGREIGRFPDEATLGASATRASQAVSRFLAFLGHDLPAPRRRQYERLLECLPTYFRRRHQGPKTLVHQDAHWRNVLYPRQPGRDSARLFDWQSWDAGTPSSDLAYMTAWHWSPEPQLALLERLVRRYHQALLQHGVTVYGWPQCWAEFRLAVARTPLGPASAWWSWGSAQDTASSWLPRVERAFVLFDALRCEAVLEP
ncbi:MAG TPA: aminoglycoside phosphotransferase family protein, partial [Chloroflexota bacterium]|nr:aminoglycoside phosphotransferase family protein [Chloroflexota bacterium]